jgi:hypothetical protein
MPFTDIQLAELRNGYASINTVDPCGKAYPKLIAMLDKCNQATLKQLADANIKFVSVLARNRINSI